MSSLIQFSQVIAGTMKWGAWGSKFNTAQYLQLIEECIGMGVTSFGHADVYGHYTTEAEFGKALQLNAHLRTQIQLISKCGLKLVNANDPQTIIQSYDTSKEHIIRSLEQSLIHLHTDYLDALLLHRPDPLMDPHEIAEAFSSLRKAGKVLRFGVCNFSPSQVELIASFFPIDINEFSVSIVNLRPFDDGTLGQCMMKNILPLAQSPLDSGNLFLHEGDERHQRISAVATVLGEKYGFRADQILMSWLMNHPAGLVPVLGTSKVERIRRALESRKIKLTRQEWFMLWRASTGMEAD